MGARNTACALPLLPWGITLHQWVGLFAVLLWREMILKTSHFNCGFTVLLDFPNPAFSSSGKSYFTCIHPRVSCRRTSPYPWTSLLFFVVCRHPTLTYSQANVYLKTVKWNKSGLESLYGVQITLEMGVTCLYELVLPLFFPFMKQLPTLKQITLQWFPVSWELKFHTHWKGGIFHGIFHISVFHWIS